MNLFSITDDLTVQLDSYKMHKRWELFWIFKKFDNIAHNFVQLWNISQSRGAFLRWRTYYVRPPSPHPPIPLPDHIEGAHPLLGGEIRSLLFWLAPLPRAALYYHNLLLPPLLQPQFGLRLRSYSFLSLSQLCWSCQSGDLETWPSSRAHKCGSFRAGPQILSKLSKK